MRRGASSELTTSGNPAGQPGRARGHRREGLPDRHPAAGRHTAAAPAARFAVQADTLDQNAPEFALCRIPPLPASRAA